MCGSKGKTRPVQAAHILSRRYKATRWDPWNGVSLCAAHHLWGHASPSQFRDWARFYAIGTDTYDRLSLLAHSKPKKVDRTMAMVALKAFLERKQ